MYSVTVHASGSPCTWIFTCLYLLFYPFVSPHLSVDPCFHHCFCGSFCFGHVSRLQRFEGFRNDKTMPPSLEPSSSGATEEGPVTANHLRFVPNTYSTLFIFFHLCIYLHFSQSMSTLSELNVNLSLIVLLY